MKDLILIFLLIDLFLIVVMTLKYVLLRLKRIENSVLEARDDTAI